MSLTDLLLLLLVAGLCGAAGQAIAGYSRGGCLAAVALGFIGSLLGTFLSRALGLPELFVVRLGGSNLPIVWSVIGATLFVAGLSLIMRRRG